MELKHDFFFRVTVTKAFQVPVLRMKSMEKRSSVNITMKRVLKENRKS